MNRTACSVAGLRISFGLCWAIAAFLKWQPAFQQHFLDQITGAQDGQPAFISAWIGMWGHIIGMQPSLFAILVALTETLIALLLLTGAFNRVTCGVGIVFSLLIWSVPEGLGGPYVFGQSTDIGTGLIYAIVFALLLYVEAGDYYGLDGKRRGVTSN